MAKDKDRDESSAGDELPREITPGGSEVYRHELRRRLPGEPLVTFLKEDEMEAIEEHVKKWAGPFENVLHEIVSEGVHLDLLVVHSSDEGTDYTQITTMGMSAVPMHFPEVAPEDKDDLPSPYAELMIIMPGHWPKTEEELKEGGEEVYWPYRVIKQCGRIPVSFESFLAVGHTVPNGDPPEPYYEGCGFMGVLLISGAIFEGFEGLKVGDKQVDFLMLVPLYLEEMQFKLQEGASALIDKMLDAFEEGVMTPYDLADSSRPNLCED